MMNITIHLTILRLDLNPKPCQFNKLPCCFFSPELVVDVEMSQELRCIVQISVIRWKTKSFPFTPVIQQQYTFYFQIFILVLEFVYFCTFETVLPVVSCQLIVLGLEFLKKKHTQLNYVICSSKCASLLSFFHFIEHCILSVCIFYNISAYVLRFFVFFCLFFLNQAF